MWHSQETAHDRPHTDSNGVWWLGSLSTQPKPDIPNSTQLNATQRYRGIPPASRLQAEEDVKTDHPCEWY
jgi:hypothetical protein